MCRASANQVEVVAVPAGNKGIAQTVIKEEAGDGAKNHPGEAIAVRERELRSGK
jgi:hypothetical protein